MYKKTLSKIILLSFILGFSNISFASDSNYEIYKNRLETICEEKVDNKFKYKPDGKISSLLKNETVYENPDSKTGTGIEQASTLTGINDNFDAPFIKAKGIYKTNMNNIYKCALLKIQIKELGNIQKLIKTDTTGELGKSIDEKITSKIKKLETISIDGQGSGSCTNTDKTKEFDKKEVLQNVTYETCKYISYLDFLRNYYKNTQNLLVGYAKNDDSSINKGLEAINGVTSVNSVQATYNKLLINIDKEDSHVTETFPIVFQSYNEYAYNYPLHVLLEIIKEDLVIFRDKLHAVLNPINQVVYKISNAMSK